MFGSVVNFGTSVFLWLSSNNFFCEVAILEAIFCVQKDLQSSDFSWVTILKPRKTTFLSEVVGVIPTRSIWMGIRAPLQLGFPSEQELFRFYALLFVQFPSTTVDGSEIPNNHRLDV